MKIEKLWPRRQIWWGWCDGKYLRHTTWSYRQFLRMYVKRAILKSSR